MPKMVYSYDYVDASDDVQTVYLVEETASVSDGGTTTYIYRKVDIHVTLAAVSKDNGDEVVGALKPGVEVTARLPDTTDYKHINFGVWAGLGEAENGRYAGHCRSRCRFR